MPKVCFATKVKYNGVNYAPNTPFEIPAEAAAEFCKKGGWIIEEPVIEKPKPSRRGRTKVKED